MRKLTVFNLFIAIALILGSCATSNDVVSNRLISKRKYTKGFFIKKNNSNKSKGEVKEVELAQSHDVKTENSTINAVTTPKSTELSTGRAEVATSDVVDFGGDVATIDDDISTVVNSNRVRNYEAQNTESVAEITVTKEQKKELKKELKKESKKNNSSSGGDAFFILVVILTILIPPLGVLVYTNIDWMKVLISLILTLLFYLPGLIYSLLVIFDVI